MSQIKEEPSLEEPDEVNSSENSSTSSCSVTVTTNSHSGSGSGSSASSSSDRSTSISDSDNDLDNSHKHRHCHLSKGHLNNPDSLGTASKIEDKNDDKVIDGKQSNTGHKCDSRALAGCSATTICSDPTATTTNTHIESSPPYPQPAQRRTQEVIKQKLIESKVTPNRLSFADEQIIKKNYQYETGRQNLTANTTSLGSSYSNLSSTITTNGPTTASSASSSRRILKPAPTPSNMTPSESTSLTALDTNNNKNHDNTSSTSRDGLSSKRTNFSKSASGSRLVNRSRPSACDCLSQDCGEKKHSNRRQFIEHYYSCRTQLSSVDTSISSFNISTPLNRLNECDAITKRLLSSPIRTSNVVESSVRGVQMSDADKSRRASLGATTMTDHVLLYASNPFKSLESSYKRSFQDKQKSDNQRKCDVDDAHVGSENDVKSKQQARSLSVCDEETLNPRLRISSSNHSSNLNRAISLACESGSASSTRRALTLIPLFGCDIKSLEQFTSSGLILPPVIDSAVNHILADGINSIGIFRKSGVKTRILTLRQRIEANQFVKIVELNQNNEFSIYDIADLVKMWFRELKPLPLMSKDLIRIISSFLNATTGVPQQSKTILKRGSSSQQQQKESSNIRSDISSSDNVDLFLRSRIDAITTPTHRALLLRALNFLAQISAKCKVNQMTSQNLAICLTPSLCETESDQNSILVDQKALEYCIDNHRMLFGRPNMKS